jgi:hypothetical protein
VGAERVCGQHAFNVHPKSLASTSVASVNAMHAADVIEPVAYRPISDCSSHLAHPPSRAVPSLGF